MIIRWFMPVNILVTFLLGSALGWITIKLTRPPKNIEGLIVGVCSAGNHLSRPRSQLWSQMHQKPWCSDLNRCYETITKVIVWCIYWLSLLWDCIWTGNLGNLPIIIIPAICQDKGSPFGDPDVCYQYGMAYASLSMAVCNFISTKNFLIYFLNLCLLIFWGNYRLELFLYGLMCTT